MVDHSILLDKLEHYDIRGLSLDWLKSYLSDRKQFVSINGVNSTPKIMTFGVPQGSILGPLLFLIYINDIPEIARFAKFILYADDANIILTADTIEEIQNQLTELIEVLIKWVFSNGLALNLKKTNYMIFSKRKVNLPTTLSILNVPIERKPEARFLGVIIDESLSWSYHIKSVVSKMSRYIGVMFKIKKFLPLKSRLQVYHSFVQSYLSYCSLVWGFCCRSNIETLFRKQKIGIRAVVPGFINYKYKDGITPGHTKSYFSKFKILTIQNVVALNTLLLMHKIYNIPKLLPRSICMTISEESPRLDSTHITCENWLATYNNHGYINSFFCKGPLIYIMPDVDEILGPTNKIPLKQYKNSLKDILLDFQGSGSEQEWLNDNFILYKIAGLRTSKRNENIVSYIPFFEK
jgi:hypothetical protein